MRELNNELKRYGITQPETVIVRVSFDSNASFPKLLFQLQGFVSEEQLTIIDTRVGSEEVKNIISGTGDFSEPASTPAPAKQITEQKAAPQANPFVKQSQAAPKVAAKPVAKSVVVEAPAPKATQVEVPDIAEELQADLEKEVANILNSVDD